MKKCNNCGILIDNRSIKCKSCTQLGKNNNNYKDGRTIKAHKCKNCHKQIFYETVFIGSGLCRSCANSGSLHNNYKDGRTLKKYHCKICQKHIGINSGIYGNKQCLSCMAKNRHYSKETKKKLSLLMSGKNHWNWQNGKSFERYSIIWTKELKEQIRKRDNRICQLCGKNEKNNGRKLDVHHMDYNKKNCKENNLISLCHSCHIKTNYNRDYWFAYCTYLMEIKQ